jgi:hypothetical protein
MKEAPVPDTTLLDDVMGQQDVDELLRLLDTAADVNELTCWGSLLKRAIRAFETHPRLSELVVELLRRGADPRLLTEHRSGPLFSAVIIRNAEVVRLLLEAGAQPNEEWDEPESLYDWAEFDYRFEEYYRFEGYGLDLPEEPSPQDRESEDAWLRFLERLASTHGRRPPDYLRLLRDHGAKTSRELEAERASGHSRPDA